MQNLQLRFLLLAILLTALPLDLVAQTPPDTQRPIHFQKRMLAAESYESVGVFDVNGDDTLDVVSGRVWYQGPHFVERHAILEISSWAGGQYYNDFGTIPMDVNGDGYMDFVTGGWAAQGIRWVENPGPEGAWANHHIDSTGPVECPRAWDVDGDGILEVVPNNPGRELKYYRLDHDGTGKPQGTFTRVDVAAKQGHGLGFGDINGDGRGDFVVSNGWLEAPADPASGTWVLHEDFVLGTASVPILVEDVNGDGTNDLIVGQGHGYGLDWYEQGRDVAGNPQWVKHPIDPYSSQYHAMEWADLTGDGQPELITGKRFRAHNGHDPGSNDPLGLYYFQWNGDSFTKHAISYGPLGVGKGTGLFFSVADLQNDGLNDLVVAGKDGLYVFYNQGAAR